MVKKIKYKMPDFSVILLEPKYQGNIGAVARAMKNFGFKNLILINPPEIGGEARAMSMHGRDVLENATCLNSFNELKERFDFLVATTAITAGDRNALRSPILPGQLETALDLDGNIGLVFGREDYGLFNKEILMCDLLVSIPTSAEYPTLSLSHSVAIILYEISKLDKIKIKKKERKFREANRKEKEILLEKFDDLVDTLYENDFKCRLAKKTFRTLMGRAFISGRESFTLIGVFRRANDRIRRR